MHELLDLEEQGWRALSTPGPMARQFYSGLLRADAVMLFPGGLRIAGREAILESFGTQPWDSFHLDHASVLALGPDSAVVVYEVRAQRDGSAPYVALVSSVYARDAQWRLVMHQQTPV